MITAGIASILFLSSSAPVTPIQGAPKPGQGPVVLGTKQLPGEFGKFGTTYTIGKDLPFNFTLLSAEYRVDRFLGDDGSGIMGWMPKKDEKLLVLKYSVQNPNKTDARLWYGTFNIIGITGDDQNIQILNRPIIGSNKKYMDVQLKPAQKATLTAVMRVPGDGELPKLMIQCKYEPKAAVIRYDLRGKVAKLGTEFSEDGFTPKKTFAGALDKWLPFPAFDVKVSSFAKNETPIASLGTPKGSTQWIAKVSVKGFADQANRLWYGCIDFSIKTADGDLIEPRVQDRLLRMSSEQTFDGPIRVDEEMSFRLVVDLPDGVSPSELRLSYKNWDDRYRPVVIKL